MWNNELYKKILNAIKERGSFKGQPIKSKEKLYLLLSDELHVSYHAVKGWARDGSSGPGDEDVLKDLENLLGTNMNNDFENGIVEETKMKVVYSDFVKENIQKGYDLMMDYICSEEVEDENEYCKMREELSKLRVAIPKVVYDKIEKCADDYLEPIIYDYENFFAELYTDELGYFDEDHVFHLKDEAATFKHMGLFLEKIYGVQKQIEKFGIEELYPILVS